MPTTSPIDGAYYFPEAKTYVAHGSVEAGRDAVYRAQSALQARGEAAPRAARMALQAGEPAAGAGVMALQAGSERNDRAAGAVTVHGEIPGPPLRSSLTVASLLSATQRAFYQGLETSDSGALLTPALLALVVRGEVTRAARRSLTARRESAAPARLALTVQGQATYRLLQALTAGGVTEARALLALEARAGDNFLILADLLQEDVAASTAPGPAGYYRPREIQGRLRVNGVEVPIKSFQYQEPTGRLGALLNVALAKRDPNQVPAGASISFDILLRTAVGQVTVPLISGGKLSGRDYRIAWGKGPDDEVTFGALDVMADKFTLAPRRPVVVFDPDLVRYTDVQANPRDAILDEQGNPILPVIEPVGRLTMHQVLKRAYTVMGGYSMMTRLTQAQTAGLVRVSDYLGSPARDQKGLGFAQVVTNIPDFPVSRADFTVEGGWHSGAQPCVGMFNPVYFVVGQTLYVMDTEFTMPAGAAARPVTLSAYLRLQQSAQLRQDANAVLLTYQERGTDEDYYFQTRYEEVTDKEGGAYGDPGYTEVRTRRKIVEKVDALTGQVISGRDEEVFVETRTAGANGILYVAHEETQVDTYQDDLKTGHHKVVKGLLLVGSDSDAQLRTILTEDCTITWVEDPVNPGSKVQSRNHTVISGLVYHTADTQERFDPATGQREDVTVKYPALVAQASGVITDDGHVQNETIKTITETMRHVSGNQYDVSVVVVDHLTGTVQRSSTSPRSGSASSDPYAVRAKTVLLRDEESEAAIGPRVPVAVNSGELPRDRALVLGWRVLGRLKNPLHTVSMDVPGVDFAVRRGSVIVGQLRSGQTARHLVTGFTITGNNLGRQGHNVKMTLEATELPS